MTCLLDTKDNNKNVDSLAKDLSTIDGKLEVDLVEKNHQIAYHILACNNGYFPDFTPEGEPSPLFDMLMQKYRNNRHMAILAKSYIYTPLFAARYGNWMVEGKPEPSYQDIQDDLERDDIYRLFPGCDMEEIEAFIQKCYDRQILNAVSTDPLPGLPETIEEDRARYVADMLGEEEYSDYERMRLEIFYQDLYNTNKINEILTNVHSKLAKAWNIRFDGEGNAINPYESLKDKKKKSALPSPYEIYQFRCNLLNSLRKSQINPFDSSERRLLYENRQYSVLLSIIKSFLMSPNDIQVKTLTSKMMDAYVDLFKGTDVVVDALKQSGQLKPDSHGNITKESKAKAISEFKKQLDSEAYLYSDEGAYAKFRRSVASMLAAINNFLLSANYIISRANVSTAGIITGFAAGSAAVAIGAPFAAGAGIAFAVGAGSFVSSKLFLNNFPDSYEAYQQYHESLRQVFLAASLNQQMYLSDDATEYDSLISEMMDNTRGDRLQKTLLTIKKNIVKQLKSLESVSEDSYSHDTSKRKSQADMLKELLRFCENALLASSNVRQDEAHKFLNRYLEYADKLLDDANRRLDEMLKDVSNIDPHELMRLKTDVIWPYGYTIGQYLLEHWVLTKAILPGDERLADGTYKWMTWIEKIMSPRINNVKAKFSRITKQYVESQVKDYLKETAGQTIQGDMYKRFEENTIKWLSNQVLNGNIGFLDQYINPARDNTSPIIRMAAQRLKEIETIVQRESNEAGAEIERVRELERKLNFGDMKGNVRKLNERLFINPFLRFCERDEDGKFTANFISDTNYGQYYEDASRERDFLIKKWGIKTSKKELLWDEETTDTYESTIYIDGKKITQTFESKWLAYNTDIVLWMAGAERGKDGIYRLTSGTQPRVHRRYTYQYYLDKIAILGKDGCSILSSINADINNIQQDCLTVINVPVRDEYGNIQRDTEGNVITKQRKVPIIAKLTEDQRTRLQMAMNQKHDLSNSVYIRMDDSLKHIIGIERFDDPGYREQLAKKFHQWSLKKREYYVEDSKPSYDLFYAVRDDYLKRIDEAEGEEKSSLLKEFDTFVNDSTLRMFKEELTSRIKKGRKIEYDMEDEDTREYFELKRLQSEIRHRILSKNKNRTPDLSKIGLDTESDPDNVVRTWRMLKAIDERITELYKDLVILNQEDPEEEKGRIYERSQLIENELIPVLDDDEEETRGSFAYYLMREYGLTKDDLQYEGTDGNMHWLTLLKRPGFKTTVLDLKRKLPSGEKVTVFNSFDEAYEDRPTGIFSESQSIMLDKEFDEDNQNYIQVNKNHERYNNEKEYNKVKDDELYKKLLEIMDKSWENYKGLTRRNKYQLPQREASTTSMWGRGVTQGFTGVYDAWKHMWGSAFNFNTRDTDIGSNALTRSDGTVVETVPTRWLASLEHANRIDSDLVSSVVDFYTESLRYKYRTRLVPVMEALLFTVSGGTESAADAGSSQQANLLRSEMSRALYGRETTGFGENGRIAASEAHLAKLSKIFRSALHKRLMSHNFMSVLKNGFDSFCNLCSLIFTAKYIMTQNVLRGLFRILIYDGDGGRVSAISQIMGIRRSKATTMTTALMLLNMIHQTTHERFEGQNKWLLRRVVEMAPTIEFEAVDYTAKALITEAVYDSYRLVWNPITKLYQYMNESEAENAYMQSAGREAGYKAWSNARKYTLRKAYYFDKATGLAKLKDVVYIHGNKLNLIDIVRPKSNLSISDDKRSLILETKIRTEITQMSSVVNGMLETEDKNKLAKHYLGAFITAFRGWMISQSGEYMKNGSDFYDWDDDADLGKGLKKFFKADMMLKQPQNLTGTIEDRNFEGQYNFATGTIDKGFFVDLEKVVFQNMGTYLRMTLFPFLEYFGNSKARFLRGKPQLRRSVHDFYQIRNAAATTDAMLLTLVLACYAFSCYSGGGDDEKYEIKTIKSLLYASAVASIVERFPAMGRIPFVLGGLDLVNAATVFRAFIDDAKYISYMFSDFADNAQSIIDNGKIDEEADQYQSLVNGSFQGRAKWDRNLTKAMALFNIDTLPILLALDAANAAGVLPESVKDTKFRHFNLNYTKNATVKSNANRANWYLDLMPASWLAPVMQADYLKPVINNFVNWGILHKDAQNFKGFPIKKPKGETKSKESKSTPVFRQL